jgi:cephalosporin hydroxylase
MGDIKKFEIQRKQEIAAMGRDAKLQKLGLKFLIESSRKKYSYHFDWLGLPIIQFPQDIVAMQEIVWRVKPEVIIETGIARGGSLIFYASLLELLGRGKAVGIDIDIREHNKKRILAHPLAKRIIMIEGSSVDPAVVSQAAKIAEGKRTLICLDSNHTGSHVAKELELYAPLVSKGSYLVAFDTVIEFLPKDLIKDRSWHKGNNPLTAVKKFLKKNKNFVIDQDLENKLLTTVAPDGYLKRIK